MTALKSLKNYFKDAYSELRKVVWPTQKQTVHYSIVVVVMSLGIAIFFGVLDYILNLVVGFLI